ncbi:MAG: hypothetical protein ABFR62_03545 [Bacteroidota bacterium]
MLGAYHNIKLYFFLLLLILFGCGTPKPLIISENLSSNSQKFKVKLGTQWMGKTHKISFGDYAVVESKSGWEKTKSSSNFFGTKSESETSHKFSLKLMNKTNGMAAWVRATKEINIKATHEIEFLTINNRDYDIHFTAGEDELLLNSLDFAAFITIEKDTTEIWSLFMIEKFDVEEGSDYYAVLTNGEEKFLIYHITSDEEWTYFDNFPIPPASGYEFYYDQESVAAFQYYGGGTMGQNDCIVWLGNNLDEKTELILAAGITAMLEITVNKYIYD